MKARFLALVALVLGLASCQKDTTGFDVVVDGEQETTICVSLPEATRADSALGAFNNVDLSGDATIRYILKIYQKVGNEYVASTDRQVEYSDEKSVVFPVRLVPNRDYRFVVWADYVEREDDVDYHYNTADLTNITLNDTWVAMDETRDAFTGVYCTVKEGKQYTSASSINILLKRPFAKLRVITNDMVELGYLGVNPTYATVAYATPYRARFNALEGTAVAAVDSNVKSHDVFAIAAYDDNTPASKVLFTDYLFAEQDVVKFTLSVYEDEAMTKPIKSTFFNTDIPLYRNKVTTIKGNILSDGSDIKVDVGADFDNDEPNYEYETISSAAEFYAALNNGGQYIVISDIDITSSASETRATRATAEGKVTTINLNGKTITVTNKTNEPFATVAAGNTLFLEGGNIVLAEGSTASFIKNDGNVVLSNGTLKNESDHITAAVVEGKVIVEENATVNDDNTTTVENWLTDVLANGGTYLFTEDMTASQIIVVNAKAPVVLDGNGFSLTSTATRAINVSGTTDVTIKNLNIVASGERAINVIQNSQKVTIENVTATAANYTVNVATSAPNAVVAIKNSTLNGLCTVNVASAGAEVTVDGSTVNCNDNNTTVGESYAALSLTKDAVGGKIIATNTAINVAEGSDSLVAKNLAEDGVITIDGSDEDVLVLYAVITYPGSDYYYAFQTIAEAVEFADNGDKISLIRDVELTETLIIAEGKTVTLDLNGKTLARAEMAKQYAINNLGTLTITGNGTVNSRGIYNGYGNGEANVASAKLTIENGTFNAKGEDGGAAIFNYGVVEVKGGKFESIGSYGLNNQPGASMTITGGEIRGGIYNCGTLSVDGENTSVYQHISGRHAIYNYAATAIINNGAFDSESGNELILADGENSSVTINGGTFDKTAKSWLMGAATGKNITFVINGGTFRGYVNKPEMTVDTFRPYGDPIVVCGGNFNFNPTQWLSDDYKAIEKDGKYYVVDGNAAKIGETKYATLQEAVDAAENGATVTFISDIDQVEGVVITDKNITIDLGGNTFTVTEGANTNNRNFKVNGSSVVTIKNGTMVAQGDITSGAYGTLRTEGTANVTLEKVKLYSYRGYGLNVKVCTGTIVTINNSEIYSQYGGGVEAAGGIVELNDVKIDQKGVYSSAAWCSVAIGVNGEGKVTVNSGNYSASAISTDANAAQGTWVAYVMSSGGTLDIKGGTFNGVVAETSADANACGLICADRAAVVEIHGGKFNSNGAILDMRNNVGTLPNPKATLFGGTFSADPRVSGLYASNLITVAEGKTVQQNADGIWEVK